MFNSLLNYLNTHTPLLYFTQSLWRDEAFSVLIAEPGGLETIRITSADFNPPLYYLILNFWMKLFGKSEIAIRSLSLIFFISFLLIFYKFAKKIFKGKWPQVATLIAAVNPMLVYYAFEARMYSLYAFLTCASMYFFYLKRWPSYIIVTTLALYTHPFTIFVPLTQWVFLFLKKKFSLASFKTLIVPFIFYLPWLFVIFEQFKRSSKMWIYPVNLNLISSVLGNLFTNFEGTPHFLWGYMKIITFIFLFLFILAFLKKENRGQNLIFFLWVFVPLVSVLSVSFLKPIYVNRYLITVSVAQMFLLILSISCLPLKKVRLIATTLLFSISVFFLLYLPSYIKKVDIRSTFAQVNSQARENDLVFANTPLVFFESLYYFHDRSRVFLYNPNKVSLPDYLGKILIPEEKHLSVFPEYPQRTFMIYENGQFELFSSLPIL